MLFSFLGIASKNSKNAECKKVISKSTLEISGTFPLLRLVKIFKADLEITPKHFSYGVPKFWPNSRRRESYRYFRNVVLLTAYYPKILKLRTVRKYANLDITPEHFSYRKFWPDSRRRKSYEILKPYFFCVWSKNSRNSACKKSHIILPGVGLPDWRMALWYKFLESGESKWRETDAAPADSPNSVMLLESPPNRSMLSLMNWSAMSWSNNPAFPGTYTRAKAKVKVTSGMRGMHGIHVHKQAQNNRGTLTSAVPK